MKARIINWLRDLWWQRPVLVRHSTLADQFTDGILCGLTLAEEKRAPLTPGPATRHASRITSTGRTLELVSGGAR